MRRGDRPRNKRPIPRFFQDPLGFYHRNKRCDFYGLAWNPETVFGLISYYHRGTVTMTDIDDLGTSHVPAIDWRELFTWALLIGLMAGLTLVLIAK
jgi:hypothetical protein